MTTAFNANKRSIVEVETLKVEAGAAQQINDHLAVEEPLEIFVAGNYDGEEFCKTVAVTMRTPGNDEELALGFLFSEGIINGFADVENLWTKDCNFVGVSLRTGLRIDDVAVERQSFVNSSCGVCGKKSIEAVMARRKVFAASIAANSGESPAVVSSALILELPDNLRKRQDAFESTGGIHAAALFDLSGNLLSVQEDVGRHNALDKLIGSRLPLGALPLKDCILLLSGRASFELIQKAAGAGIPIVAAVGAPSSLAVELAKECDVTLLGFVRGNRFNIYSGENLILF